MEEPIVKVSYALTKKDLMDDELGRYKPMPLSKALQIVERMLRGGYIMVRIVKEGV